jgi:hypothetical protein
VPLERADSALIQLEGHGRETLFDDIDLTRSVGWFTSAYPLRLTPLAEQGASIKAIKEQLRGVPHKGLGYGVLRYLADDLPAEPGGLPSAASPSTTSASSTRVRPMRCSTRWMSRPAWPMTRTRRCPTAEHRQPGVRR